MGDKRRMGEMIRQRKLSTRGFAHAVAESVTHAEDVEQAGRRRQVTWIPVEIPTEDGHIHCAALGKGWQFILRQEEDGRALLLADEAEFVKHLTVEAKARGHYFAPMADKKSGVRMVRRKKSNPIEQLAVCLPPWSSELLRELAAAGQAEGVRRYLNQTASRLCDEFEQRTHRRVLGIAVHTDTTAIHFHLQFTRVGVAADGPVNSAALDPVYARQAPEGRNYLLGSRELGTIGAATCAGLNMLLVGAIQRESEEYRRIQHSVSSFEQRRGIVPIDWLLWQVANECFKAAFGMNPRLPQLVSRYRRASVQRRLAALEAVRARVAAEVVALEVQNLAEGPSVGCPGRPAGLLPAGLSPRPRPVFPAFR
jgi:hypothetical protein